MFRSSFAGAIGWQGAIYGAGVGEVVGCSWYSGWRLVNRGFSSTGPLLRETGDTDPGEIYYFGRGVFQTAVYPPPDVVLSLEPQAEVLADLFLVRGSVPCMHGAEPLPW